MGITSLSHVRVSNLQELIYNNGNSGIEKATVSLTFDNRRKGPSSPIGLQDLDEFTITRQVVKGGKSKYYLNGTGATNERIKGIFQSVQLNINNPHFLIMQGKVTQVVKMKPKGLLSLLEETAGTSLYEGKKKVARATIEKKDKKLQEIEMLCGPIQEKIEKHKQEKEMLVKYKTSEDKLSKVRRILVAHEYYKLTQAINSAESERVQLIARKEMMNADLVDLNKTLKGITQKQEKHNKASENEEIHKNIEKQREVCNTIQRELNKCSGEIIALSKKIGQEQEDEKSKCEEIEQLKEIQNRKSKEVYEFKITMSKNDALIQDKEKYLASLEEQFNSSHSKEDLLEPFLKRIEQLKSQMSLLRKDIDMRTNNCQNLLKQREELEQAIKKSHSSIITSESTRSKLLSDLENVNKELERIDQGTDSTYQRAMIQHTEFKKRYDGLQATYNDMQLKYRFDIEYKMSVLPFDKKKIFGRVLMLFKPVELKYAKALEYIAGSKLWFIVVESEQISKQAIDNDCFVHRETCIPNNKILSRSHSSKEIGEIEAREEGRVHYALNIIKYDQVLDNTMRFVFGGMVIISY